MEVWIIPEIWAIIKSFLLEDEWKWKFREVVKELPKAIYMHLAFFVAYLIKKVWLNAVDWLP